ncbi:MAG TPA: metallophosphoesterase [Oligoflexia bacterium]|nr:metallophosphoesterase [Oligoflexia bacterium]HMP26921.1 metallophosphoesterase [Oligoflexia bacterium]
MSFAISSFFFLLLFGEKICCADQIIAGPYLQDANKDNMTVAWVASDKGYGKLRIISSTTERRLFRGAPSNYRAVKVFGLKPSTSYRYYILADSGSKKIYKAVFKTSPESGAEKFRAVVFGDSGTASPEQFALAKKIEKVRPNILIHTGDLIYPKGERENYFGAFFEPYRRLLPRIPFYPALGNHDVSNIDAYLDYFHLPKRTSGSERYYSFVYGAAEFFALDSNLPLDQNSNQYLWLKDNLSQKQENLWRIVFFHHPPFSAGGHGDTLRVRESLVPLFEKYQVNLVISGHEHSYQRSHLNNERGIIRPLYMVTGGGGAPLAEHQRDSEKIAVYFRAFHFVILDIDQNLIKTEVIDLSGKVIDNFSLER